MKQGERSFANSHQDDLPVTSHYATDSLDVWPDHRAVTNWPAQSLTQRKPDSTEVRKRLDRYCDSGDPAHIVKTTIRLDPRPAKSRSVSSRSPVWTDRRTSLASPASALPRSP